jgi:hypothetical protein
MFGFLRPSAGWRRYRQAYARLCQYQQIEYGRLSLPFLSYEGALLYLFATEAGWFPAPEDGAPVCCRLRQAPSLLERPEAPLGRFCASLGLLLASIKLDDDVRDGGSWPARLARWTLRKRLQSAHRYFQSLDEEFDATTNRYLDEHLQFETGARRPSLHDYAAPTARAFGYVFSRLSRVAPYRACGEALHTLGTHVGAAIIAFDCGADWRRDQCTGNYNPLCDHDDVRRSYAYCEHHLSAAARLCRDVHGERSLSATVLAGVAERVRQRQIETPHVTCREELQSYSPSRLRRAGYAFADLGLLAFADCACDGLGACCELGGGAAEGGGAAAECCGGEACCHGGAEGGYCCAEFCCIGGTDSCGHRNQNRTKSAKGKDIELVNPPEKVKSR